MVKSSNYKLLLCCRKVEGAVFKQMKKLWHTTNIYLHSPIHEYAEKLVSKMPGDLKVQLNNFSRIFNVIISLSDTI